MAVYEPAEDSELLMSHIDFSGLDVLDMGTGSGILAKKALSLENNVTAVDINPEVIEKLKGEKRIRLIVSDLFENVKGKFDVVMFNAPYLPAEDEDVIWDGGPTGRKVLERFARQFGSHLKPKGKVLMVISSLTGLEETMKLFSGYDAKIIDKTKVAWEELLLVEIKGRLEPP